MKLKKEGKADSVQNLISFDAVTEDQRKQAQELGLTLYHINEVIDAGEKAGDVKFEEPTPETIYMFCYTSGTTGDPKAAMLDHGNYIAASAAAFQGQPGIDETCRIISYLPLAHSLEQAIFTLAINIGIQIGFYSGDPSKLLDDLQVLKPHIFPSVPRLYSRIYDKVMAGVREKSNVQQWLFNRALKTKIYYLET